MSGPHQLTCDECVERLYEYLDRELTPDWEREISAHLDECAVCLRHFGFERMFLELVARRGRAGGASHQLRDRIVQMIRDKAGPERG